MNASESRHSLSVGSRWVCMIMACALFNASVAPLGRAGNTPLVPQSILSIPYASWALATAPLSAHRPDLVGSPHGFGAIAFLTLMPSHSSWVSHTAYAVFGLFFMGVAGYLSTQAMFVYLQRRQHKLQTGRSYRQWKRETKALINEEIEVLIQEGLPPEQATITLAQLDEFFMQSGLRLDEVEEFFRQSNPLMPFRDRERRHLAALKEYLYANRLRLQQHTQLMWALGALSIATLYAHWANGETWASAAQFVVVSFPPSMCSILLMKLAKENLFPLIPRMVLRGIALAMAAALAALWLAMPAEDPADDFHTANPAGRAA